MNDKELLEIQRFWKKCGFTFTPHLTSKGNPYKTTEIIHYPDGFSHIVNKGESIELDLNNLFKYAVPKLIYDSGIGVSIKVLSFGVCTTTYLAQAYQVADNVLLASEEAEDPAQAVKKVIKQVWK